MSVNSLNNKIFNYILENIIYQTLWEKKKIKIYIGNNTIEFIRKEKEIQFSINWINTSENYEKNNYSDFVFNLVEWLENIINFYLLDCKSEKYSDIEILEMWELW